MKEKVPERAGYGMDALKRLAFSSLWLAAMQTLSCLVCFVVINYVFGRNFQFEWLVYTLGLALPLLWGIGGRTLPAKFRPQKDWQTWIFLLVWTALPAFLCCWADLGGPDILWITFYPQMMARLTWFYPLFDGPQSAYVLNTLRPLAAAGTHVLMMAGFTAGLWLRRRQKE